MFYYIKKFYENDAFIIEEHYSEMDNDIKVKTKFRRGISLFYFAKNIGKSVGSVVDNDFDEVIQFIEKPIAELKAQRYAEIDGKTGQLIGTGFVFDSKTFSLSIPAQNNWHAIMNQKSQFTDPVAITTMHHDTYLLAIADVEDFWNAGKTAVEGPLKSGRDLKKLIFDAADKAAIDAVIDER